MPGYLLDTQTIRYWFDGNDGNFPKVTRIAEARAAEHSNAPLYVSAITLGEMFFGHADHPTGVGANREAYVRFVRKRLPQILNVSKHTAEPYGHLRSRLIRKFPPKNGWSSKKWAVEQLYDPVAGREFGFDENDIWLAAQAIERNLILVTNDKKFVTRVQEVAVEVADSLGAKAFGFENWAV